MRHSLEIRTIAALKNAKLGKGCSLIRARYVKAMQAMGYTWAQAMDCYSDVFDVADLELRAA